jgi:ketosteroid isomerase-like protein
MIRKSASLVSLVVGLGILSWIFTPSLKAGTDDAAQVRQLSIDYRTALLTRDIKFLTEAVAEDAVNIGTDGRPFDRQALIAKIEDPSFSYKKIEVEGLVVQVVGDVALTRGTAAVATESSGKGATDNFRFVRIWQRRSGKWQVIYFQATHIQGLKTGDSTTIRD